MKLKPCPFCGGKPAFGESNVGIFIECQSCHSSSTMMFPEKCDAKPLLAERWNARASAAPASPDARKLSEAGIDMAKPYERMRRIVTRKVLNMCLEAFDKHDEWCGHYAAAPGNGIINSAPRAVKAELKRLDELDARDAATTETAKYEMTYEDNVAQVAQITAIAAEQCSASPASTDTNSATSGSEDATWIEHGVVKHAPAVDAEHFGPHSYFANGRYNTYALGDCRHGCGCAMHQSSSSGPVDPFGPCPKNPRIAVSPVEPVARIEAIRDEAAKHDDITNKMALSACNFILGKLSEPIAPPNAEAPKTEADRGAVLPVAKECECEKLPQTADGHRKSPPFDAWRVSGMGELAPFHVTQINSEWLAFGGMVDSPSRGKGSERWPSHCVFADHNYAQIAADRIKADPQVIALAAAAKPSPSTEKEEA